MYFYRSHPFWVAFRSPIRLHGRVEDQHGDPVSGAKVVCMPMDAAFGDESGSTTTLTSGADGKFFVNGLHGASMGVQASMDGYLDIPPAGGPASFVMVGYADDAEQGKRYSRAETPLVLRLHKIGPMEPMVYVNIRRRSLPVDGSVKRIALDSESGIGSHQIEFLLKTGWVNIPADNEHFGDRFDWTFEARIPGGGFVWSDNDFNCVAPESGYMESIRLNYKVSMPVEQWKNYVYGNFFVKFADGSHGRIKLFISGMERGGGSPLRLGSWLNLKPGSRNLATPNISSSSASDERYREEWGW